MSNPLTLSKFPTVFFAVNTLMNLSEVRLTKGLPPPHVVTHHCGWLGMMWMCDRVWHVHHVCCPVQPTVAPARTG
jgi:hypothetical protein